MNIFTRYLIGSIILLCFRTTAYSTVGGPIKIEIIGYDAATQKLFFTRTNWCDCDFNTDLYIYDLTKDSVVIITNWINKDYFVKNRISIIAETSKTNHLSPVILSPAKDTAYSFSWLPKVIYYSQVMGANAEKCPFQIRLGNRNFIFNQCYSQKDLPIIKEFVLQENYGMVLVQYRGDCIEGNTRDELIFYRKDKDQTLSRALNVKDRLLSD